MHFCLDLSYSVKVICCFCSNPVLVYNELVKHVLQYIFGILELGLIFNKKANKSDNVIGYIDSDITKSKIDLKPIKNYIFILVVVTISH